jgi:hypothetical protein
MCIYLPQWWAGLGLVIFGSLGGVISLTFAPQSVVMPVCPFTLAANIYFANRFFGETLSRQDIFGTALITVGDVNVAAACGVLGDVPVQCFDLEALLKLYDSEVMWIYGVFVLSIMAGFRAVINRCEGLLQTIAALQSDPKAAGEIEELKKQYKRFQRLHLTSYAAVAGMFGSCSVLFASSTMQMVSLAGKGNNQFVHWEVHVFILSMLCCIMLQTHFLAHGLKYFDALFIVPVFQCFFIHHLLHLRRRDLLQGTGLLQRSPVGGVPACCRHDSLRRAAPLRS